MRVSERIRAHIRGNAVAYVALFFALNAGAYAVGVAPKNSVTSRSIKNSQVKKRDIAEGAINSQKVADDSLQGADINEASLGQVPDAAQLGGTAAGEYLKGPVGAGELAPFPAASLSTPIFNFDNTNGECNGTNSAFPSATYKTIEFATVKFDNAGLANKPNPSNECFNKLVVPADGTYLATASVGWQPGVLGSRKIAIFAENPTGPCCALHASTEGPANDADLGTHDTRLSTAGIARLDAGASIYLQGYQSSGSGLNFVNSIDSGLQLAWIGP